MVALGINRRHPPGQNPQTIHQMRDLFHRLAARLCLPAPPTRRRCLIQPEPLHQLWRIRAKRAPGRIKRFRIAPMIPDSRDQPGGGDSVGNRLGCFKIGCQRLFHKERQTCGQHCPLRWAMRKGWHANEHGIKGLVVQHRLGAGMNAGTAVGCQSGSAVKIRVGDGFYNNVRKPRQHIQMALRDPPRPDKADTCQALHDWFPLVGPPVGDGTVINILRRPGHGRGGKGLLKAGPLACSDPVRLPGAVKCFDNAARKGRWRIRGYQKRVIRPQRINNPIGPGGHNGKTRRHRLQRYQRQAFKQRRQHKQGRRPHQAGDVILRRQNGDPGQCMALDLVLYHPAKRAIAHHDQPHAGATALNHRKGGHQTGLRLLGRKPPDMQKDRLIRVDAQLPPDLQRGNPRLR